MNSAFKAFCYRTLIFAQKRQFHISLVLRKSETSSTVCPFPLLKELTVDNISSIALNCGIVVNGAKDERIQTLGQKLEAAQNLAFKRYFYNLESVSSGKKNLAIKKGFSKKTKIEDAVSVYSHYVPKYIFSVDIGYRNLAFCKLSSKYEILEWDRHSVLESESFDLSLLSLAVREFVAQYFDKGGYQTTSFCVEKQRFRTGNSNMVLNPALINGVIEALIYSNVQIYNSDITGVSSTSVSLLYGPSSPGYSHSKKKTVAKKLVTETLAQFYPLVKKSKGKSASKRKPIEPVNNLLDISTEYFPFSKNDVLNAVFTKYSDHIPKKYTSYLYKLLKDTKIPINLNKNVSDPADNSPPASFNSTSINWLMYLKSHSKKDDLADSYLQAIAFLYWKNCTAYALSLLFDPVQFSNAFSIAKKEYFENHD
ncbi:hypothetical protein BB560_000120 [Smittium megazygosporum]|uniref:Mitochondrial resolvase Ydc2 catalytic domain-containing protein n=1 Tax=Smittium megazygosporum TaxID=133381 RepID=A0A2T9ZLC0_9FUNG|nr:hypothetical protein BB560_000120 [Smittium megazygosporum]